MAKGAIDKILEAEKATDINEQNARSQGGQIIADAEKKADEILAEKLAKADKECALLFDKNAAEINAVYEQGKKNSAEKAAGITAKAKNNWDSSIDFAVKMLIENQQ